MGIRSTFPIAGPVYRFLADLGDVAEGGYQRPLKIREGDELQDLCAAMNAALEAEHLRADAERRARQGSQRRLSPVRAKPRPA